MTRWQKKCTPQVAVKTAFCGQPLPKGKPTPNTDPGPKYLTNRHNIALVQFIKDFLYRDKNTVKIKR